ncbi:hypothetical protein MTO96_021927 [Rhipicephalus appendiculatus]
MAGERNVRNTPPVFRNHDIAPITARAPFQDASLDLPQDVPLDLSRERPEACFNCRKLGHRTDVCPLPGPGIPKCRRCGGEHLPPPLGEKPTCTPQCVVCLGEHPTGSRSCKLRFTPVKHHNSRKSMSYSTNEEGRSKSPGHRSRSRTRKGSKSRNTQAASPAQTSRSPSQETSARMSTVNNYKNAWSNGPPKSVGWSTDDPGQSSKAVTTQPASNTKQGGKARNQSTSRTRGGPSRSSSTSRMQPPVKPQDNQVRELAELVKSLQQQLASANEQIRQLNSNSNSTFNPPAAAEQMACAQSEAINMETDRTRVEKRRASSPAPDAASEEKREKVKKLDIQNR